ncbi:MAG: hypothetical protein QM704_26955 [Anaeromyxobacteraceae bacterium]
MTAPRQVLQGKTSLVTRRTARQEFLLKPAKYTSALFGYLLAVASSRYGLDVHAFVVMSNHYHLVVTDHHARLPLFCQYLDGLCARAMNVEWGRSEDFWGPPTFSDVTLVTKEAVLAKVLYTLTNPVEAELVAKGSEWPGLWSSPELIGAGTLTFERPEGFFDPKGVMPEQAFLTLKTPSGYTREDFHRLLTAQLTSFEADMAKALEHLGRRVLGVKKVLKQRHTDRPAARAQRSELKPRIATRDKWRRIEALGRLKAFLEEYQEAITRYRGGAHDTRFPAGTYWMRVCFGVACAGSG